MQNVFFTSDLHFGHTNIIRFDGRPFSSIEEMDEKLIDLWNKKVSDQDIVYILGDISWHDTNRTYEIITELHGKKFLIKGNHDKVNAKLRPCFENISDYKEITLENRRIILCHYPIIFYNGQHSGAYHFYGHVHMTAEYDMVQRYIIDSKSRGVPCKMHNVGCMLHRYEPVTFADITGES